MRSILASHDRSPFRRAAQGRAFQVRAHRLSARAGRRPRRLREADCGARHQDRAQEGPRADRSRDMVTFEDPKGTVMEVFKREEFAGPALSEQGRRPAQARPCRVLTQGRPAGHQVLLRRARLPRVGLDGRLLLVPALRPGPPHHQPDDDRREPALPHRVRVARLGAPADRLRLSQPQRLQAAVGPRPARHRPQPVLPITAARTG